MIGHIPAVSVLMAVNRCDDYLESAILSILNQSFSDFEFIIVANAISEDDFNCLAVFAKADSRIRLMRIPLPGLANALNYGICHARSEFIARMDSDDISLPNRLQLQHLAMVEDPNLAVVGCKADLIDERDSVIGAFRFFSSNEVIRRVLPYRNPMLHPALMMRKSMLIKVGGYRYGHMSEDHELFIRITRDKNFNFKNLDVKEFLYRRHNNQITSRRHAKKHFAEISGFLITEFLLTYNPKYLIGSLAIHPWVRTVRNWLKLIQLRLSK